MSISQVLSFIFPADEVVFLLMDGAIWGTCKRRMEQRVVVVGCLCFDDDDDDRGRWVCKSIMDYG